LSLRSNPPKSIIAFEFLPRLLQTTEVESFHRVPDQENR
jgi:hypothetical protein